MRMAGLHKNMIYFPAIHFAIYVRTLKYNSSSDVYKEKIW